mmetsp:Transcript_3887/g.10706  ORF Transcript_3887/g.10706 Transcript_3887/m.10706 type:complete len:90 (+) Transcript_3887:81-350(+)
MLGSPAGSTSPKRSHPSPTMPGLAAQGLLLAAQTAALYEATCEAGRRAGSSNSDVGVGWEAYAHAGTRGTVAAEVVRCGVVKADGTLAR